ncbi:MAG: hypothetical protein V8R40_05240 [Dysosmobacter sp.]
MDKRLKEYLKDGECIRWQGSPERFELLERSYRIRVIGQWILSVLICGGTLAIYPGNGHGEKYRRDRAAGLGGRGADRISPG